ncbi:MAG TPA: hypothetical protein VN625_09250, partial [Desulfuromonadaceae bacterium]|nr:hypothetical protein [Desulfuromonadaceae bacterium]
MAAFIKGGCFALLLFAVAATVALLFGGQAHANPGGLILLFVLGGLGGLVVNAIYYKGRKDATRDGQGGAAGVSSPNSGDRNRPG